MFEKFYKKHMMPSYWGPLRVDFVRRPEPENLVRHYRNLPMQFTENTKSRLFGSVVRVLDFYRGGQGSNPIRDMGFFKLCIMSYLQIFIFVRIENFIGKIWLILICLLKTLIVARRF